MSNVLKTKKNNTDHLVNQNCVMKLSNLWL